MGKENESEVGFGLLRAILGILPIVVILVVWSWWLLIIYIAIGLVMMIIQFMIVKTTKKKILPDALMFIFLWPEILMLWPEIKPFKRRTLFDEFNTVINKNPALKLQRDYFQEMNKNGTSSDTLPNGIGRFGYDRTNPIPVNNIFASYAYLGRLRDNSGNPVEYERIGSMTVNGIENPIDEYHLKNKSGKFLATIYISPYQQTISKKAPDGFKLI